MAKHYENKFVKMTEISDEESKKLEKDVENGIKIYTDLGEFVFFPSKVIVDPVGEHVLYIKFNHKEKLVLYHNTQHPESRKVANDFKLIMMIANEKSGSNYAVRDIMDYIAEIDKLRLQIRDGDVQLEDGVHPEMKDALK